MSDARIAQDVLVMKGMSKETLVLLYGGRSAEREVSVLSAESVMRAINYDKFFVKTYFITKSGDFIKTQEFFSKPADDEKLMTNATVVESQKIKPSDIYEEGLDERIEQEHNALRDYYAEQDAKGG